MINNTILKTLCAPYRGIQTGILIYLFNIHNKNIINNKLFFNINAYSYCPLDTLRTFHIYFDNFTAFCLLNESIKSSFTKKKYSYNSKTAFCVMNKYSNINLDSYYFPRASTEDNIILKIFNYRKYLSIIFKNFFCKKPSKCILKVILFEKIDLIKIPLKINNKHYICMINKNYNFWDNKFPNIRVYKCSFSDTNIYLSKSFISGIPLNFFNHSKDNNLIPNQFVINRIVINNEKRKNDIIIIGKLDNNLIKDKYYMNINFIYPKLTLKCMLKPNSKFVISRIYCINNFQMKSHILIENQIVKLFDNEEELLLINEETLIKIDFINNNEMISINYVINNEKRYLFFLIIIIYLIVL